MIKCKYINWNLDNYIHSRNFPPIKIFSPSPIFQSSMEIQHHDLAQRHQQRKAVHQPMEYDDDLVQQLVTIINSLFSPLVWILEETLYRRIKKQDKGWIDIDFLNRNPTIKQIFKKNGIPSQTRRKRNILLRAIKNSILKKKKNLIKRKEYLNVNIELKKVLYLEKKDSNTSSAQSNGVQKIEEQKQQRNDFNKLTKSNLTSMIKKIAQQLMANNVNQGLHQKTQMKILQNESNQIEFYGHFGQSNEQKNKQLNGCSSIQEQKPLQQLQYRWCFVYLPHIEIEKVDQIYKAIKNVFNTKSQFEKGGQENQNAHGQVSKEFQAIKQTSYNSLQSLIQVCPLEEMIQRYYPVYEQICKQIGYKKQDVRQERLRIKRKQKQRQKIRLLESVDLQKKIDVVNQYHIKLQVQKQRKAYLKKKQAEYERKMRMRQQRKTNKSKHQKDDNDTQKIDHLTQKLKKLLGISSEEEKKQNPIPKSEDLKDQQLQEKKVEKQHAEKIEQETQQKTSKMKIKLPKCYEDDDWIQDSKVDIERNQNNEVYGSFFEDELQDMLVSSSSEDYEIPKKKSSNKKGDSKKKKIIKSHPKDSNSAKKVNKQAPLSVLVQKSKQQNQDRQKNNSNSAYNLRHKAPSQGSYLKMVESFEENQNLGHGQKIRKDRYSQKFQNVIDQAHGISNSRSLRSARKHDDHQV